jgi:hypothetical protein
MIPLLVDQNFNEHIVDGLTRRVADLDAVLARHVDLAAIADPDVLEWAASHGRVLLTHDRRTLPRFACQRVEAGERMPGVFVVSDALPTAQAIEELSLAIQCLTPEECAKSGDLFPFVTCRRRHPAADDQGSAGSRAAVMTGTMTKIHDPLLPRVDGVEGESINEHGLLWRENAAQRVP